MPRLITIVFFFFYCATSFAQKEVWPPARFLTRFRFDQYTGGVIVLQAQFGAFKDTLNFILDTGSGGISLDSTTADYFGLNPLPTENTIRGIGGIKKVSFLYNQKLHFPGLSIDSLHFHVNDYSLLTSVYGERIDGIIGYSVLSRYIVKINYDSSYIEFWTKGSIKYPRGGYLMRPAIAPLPVHPLRVRDERTANSRFLYDLGAGLNVMLSTRFIKDSMLLQKKRKLFTKQAEGLGGKVDMHMTVIKEIKLGPYKFRQVPIYVFNDEYNLTSYPHLGGLIGSDLLRRFNIILNYDKKHIHMVPNSHFADKFDYSYSGIELYLVNGEIIIGDVAKDSPAEKAGLLEGDVLIAVNKNFSQNLQALKTILQNPGAKVELVIRRGTDIKQVNFKVKSLL